jgi:hypothetical protein
MLRASPGRPPSHDSLPPRGCTSFLEESRLLCVSQGPLILPRQYAEVL